MKQKITKALIGLMVVSMVLSGSVGIAAAENNELYSDDKSSSIEKIEIETFAVDDFDGVDDDTPPDDVSVHIEIMGIDSDEDAESELVSTTETLEESEFVVNEYNVTDKEWSEDYDEFAVTVEMAGDSEGHYDYIDEVNVITAGGGLGGIVDDDSILHDDIMGIPVFLIVIVGVVGAYLYVNNNDEFNE